MTLRQKEGTRRKQWEERLKKSEVNKNDGLVLKFLIMAAFDYNDKKEWEQLRQQDRNSELKALTGLH